MSIASVTPSMPYQEILNSYKKNKYGAVSDKRLTTLGNLQAQAKVLKDETENELGKVQAIWTRFIAWLGCDISADPQQQLYIKRFDLYSQITDRIKYTHTLLQHSKTQGAKSFGAQILAEGDFNSDPKFDYALLE